MDELAYKLVRMLAHGDPLTQRVHLTKTAVAGVSLTALLKGLFRRFGRHFTVGLRKPRDA